MVGYSVRMVQRREEGKANPIHGGTREKRVQRPIQKKTRQDDGKKERTMEKFLTEEKS